jgi:hypothetical protein
LPTKKVVKKTKKKAVKRTRKAKSDQIAVPVEVVEPPKPVTPAKTLRVDNIPLDSRVKVTTDTSAVELFENPPDLLPERDELSPDLDLAEAEKAEFKRLLDKSMTLEDRARALVEMAGFRDQKRAAVALRAITIINEITGVTDEGVQEAPSMFNLPDGVQISIDVKAPDK